MKDRDIYITESDAAKLRALLATNAHSLRNQPHLDALRTELERALVLEPHEVPADVVTMNSRVRLLDVKSGGERELTVVFPADADIGARCISVLAPLGTALLGYREGDEIEWAMPGGVRHLSVEEVFQPGRTDSTRTRGAPQPLGERRHAREESSVAAIR